MPATYTNWKIITITLWDCSCGWSLWKECQLCFLWPTACEITYVSACFLKPSLSLQPIPLASWQLPFLPHQTFQLLFHSLKLLQGHAMCSSSMVFASWSNHFSSAGPCPCVAGVCYVLSHALLLFFISNPYHWLMTDMLFQHSFFYLSLYDTLPQRSLIWWLMDKLDSYYYLMHSHFQTVYKLTYPVLVR